MARATGERDAFRRPRDARRIPVATAVLGGVLGYVLLGLAVPRTIAILCILPGITCSKLRPVRNASGTHDLAGTLAVFAVACAPAKTLSASPVAETDPATLAEYPPCDESRPGCPLELTGTVLTFADEFDRRRITGPNGNGPWYAPIHGGFGNAKFLPSHSIDRPFIFNDGVLTIRSAKRGGRWTSGIFQGVNAKGEGFAQRSGDFEMRAKFPKGNGAWPAFWLKTVNQFADRSETHAEIHIIEAYGANDWSGYYATVHLWPAHSPRPDQLQKQSWKGCYERVLGDMFDDNWHLYGGEVGPEWVTIYYERREIGRFPPLTEFCHLLFVLADLGLHKEDPRTIDDPADMQIDYIRVWQRPKWVANG